MHRPHLLLGASRARCHRRRAASASFCRYSGEARQSWAGAAPWPLLASLQHGHVDEAAGTAVGAAAAAAGGGERRQQAEELASAHCVWIALPDRRLLGSGLQLLRRRTLGRPPCCTAPRGRLPGRSEPHMARRRCWGRLAARQPGSERRAPGQQCGRRFRAVAAQMVVDDAGNALPQRWSHQGWRGSRLPPTAPSGASRVNNGVPLPWWLHSHAAAAASMQASQPAHRLRCLRCITQRSIKWQFTRGSRTW